MNEQELKSMVEKLLVDMIGKAGVNNIVNEVTNKVSGASSVDENGCIPDITEIDLKTQQLDERLFFIFKYYCKNMHFFKISYFTWIIFRAKNQKLNY